MTCTRIDAELDDLLDGDLQGEARVELERHIDGCAVCAARVAQARAVEAALRARRVPGPSERFFERALASAAARRTRGARLVAFGFLGAFATTVATVIFTGLWVHAPGSLPGPETPAVAMALHESRTVNLVFAAKNPLRDVGLIVELPAGIELAGYPNAREVTWSTRLSAGNNVLPLKLTASSGRGGRLVARLTHGKDERTFVVDVTVKQPIHQGVTL
jgi:anti-sigma factor RsiW